MEECKFTIPTQYQKLMKNNPIFRLLKNNNSKTVTKFNLHNVKIQPIAIPIILLGFLPKKGQYIGPNNIVEQYVHVWLLHELKLPLITLFHSVMQNN